MEKTPEQQISQTPNPEDANRLKFEETEGWYEYGRIPYEIYYMTDCSSGEMVDEKTPGRFKVTANSGGGESLSIFIHESVPAEFKDVVAFHELREAELVYADGVERNQAHQQATTETEEYARKHLIKEEFEKFIEWQSTLDIKKN